MPAPRRSSTVSFHAPVRLRRLHPQTSAYQNLDTLLNELYRSRGAAARERCELDALLPASALHGITAAADLLATAIEQRQRLLVIGDYDADGATGSALALLVLRAFGAAEVDHLIPSRFTNGYGLSPALIDIAATRQPDLIITVDNGIANVEAIDHAHKLKIPVLITDHHLPGAELPAAAAIVNPNQPDCDFPSKCLAGVGVMFYLLAATRASLRQRGWFAHHPEVNLADYLDLVALGTVADVVTLDANNRILVEQGLRRIRAGRCRPGLRALLDIAGRRLEQLTARDLAFVAAPRLNAAGRLEDMSLGVECLVTADPVQAMQLARQLDTLNSQRRVLEADIRQAAQAVVERLNQQLTQLPPGLCLYDAGWHSGIIGIVAARLRERYQRPVIVFAPAGTQDVITGSARSIEQLHIRDLIERIASAVPGLILRFGGHAMAAGLTIKRDDFDQFRAAFDTMVEQELGVAEPVRELVSDGELGSELLTLSCAECLRTVAPWGKGFPEPLFDGIFEVSGAHVVGNRHLKLHARPPGGVPLEAIGFGLAEQRAAITPDMQLVYRLDVNDYRGLRRPQLILEHLQSTPST